MRLVGKTLILFGFGSLVLSLYSCDSAETNTLTSQTNLITSYVTTNRLQDSVTNNGNNLWYYRFKKGTGEKIESGDKVTFSYVLGYLASSTNLRLFATNIKSVSDLNGISQANTFEPITVEVGKSGLFSGMDQSFEYLYDGDAAFILMTSTLAYGSSGMGVVPSDTPIGLRVYILKVEKK